MQLTLSQRGLRDAFGLFATGVTVITAVTPDGEPVGATANSFTSVSLDPPLLLWCLASGSSTAAAFAVDAPFAVHVLASDQRETALHFARRTREKFEVDAHWRTNPSPPHLADALVRFDCRVHAVHPGGDHKIIVGRVTALARGGGKPLTFYGGRFGEFAPDPNSTYAINPWQQLHGEWF